ncbi:MAG: nucleoside-diphosphate sugar epimerase/dehydratase [Anaerolineae bacterium]|nr:nucleoside-diphosphate sugar epimerase/dehydratase [Anaerolineae bacterium]
MWLRNRYLLIADLVLLLLALLLSYFLRFDTFTAWSYFQRWWPVVPALLILYPLAFHLFGLYRRMWQYAGSHEVLAIIAAASIASAVLAILIYGVMRPLKIISGFSRPMLIIDWLLNILLLGGVRFSSKIAWDITTGRKSRIGQGGVPRRILVIGAGDAGAMIVREMHNNPEINMLPVGFVDDDERKIGNYIHGVKVYGSRRDIPELARRLHVDEALIAMPTAPGKSIREIVSICESAGIRFRTLPGLFELLNGKVWLSQIREVQLEDLLRREPTSVNLEEIAGFISGATILVTGAGGSIGSELCRQIARFRPGHLILLGHGENSIYNIEQELCRKFPSLPRDVIIADIRDANKIHAILQRYRPQIVFHSAAHKHVPLMEHNVDEAITNNVLGTRNVVQAALTADVERFVLISTDKAVRPTSIMGATKRIAEMIVQEAAMRSGRAFVAVRFGNVLGSRGSVVPLFKEQIAAGGPITITHPEMTRFFMTIPEAVQLVIQAASLATPGQIYALDMGDPIRIVDLAKDLVELSGLKLGRDIEIVYTGLRPGEKLHEELFTRDEQRTATVYEKIFIAQSVPVDGDRLYRMIDLLAEYAAQMDEVAIRRTLRELVPDFQEAEVPLLEGGS